MVELPQSLHAKLRDQLRASILQGALQPGDQLPSEAQLQQQHGVSRITVRNALSALQAEGLIVKLHGKGAFVAPPRTAQVLHRLEGLHEALGAEAHQVHNQLLAWKTVKPSTQVAAWLDLAANQEVYQLHTVRYVDRQPLSINTSWLLPSLGSKLLRVDLSHRDLIEVFEHEGGLSIGRADVEISAGQAQPLEAEKLQLAPNAAVLVVLRRIYTAQDQCVHIERAVHRAETFHYQLSLKR